MTSLVSVHTSSPDDSPVNHQDAASALGRNVYTRRHRDVWPLLVSGPEAEGLEPSELSSWLRLWGHFGAELYQCFRHGDAHIRTDMISLARTTGGWSGGVVASRLECWLKQLSNA